MNSPEAPAPFVGDSAAVPLRSKKGVASLVIGIIAVVVCCVPILSIPLGIVGLVLGIMALTAAKRTQERRIGVPVAGTVLGALAVLLGVIAIPFSLGLLLPALAKARETARERVSHRADPEFAALWTAHDQPCRVGDVQVLIREIGLSNDAIAFTLEVRNLGAAPLHYHGLIGDLDGSPLRKARLTDNMFQSYEIDRQLSNSPGTETDIPANGAVEETIAFDAPQGDAEYIDLELPGRPLGLADSFRFRIPMSALPPKGN